jgi:Tol biopolymer transport system component
VSVTSSGGQAELSGYFPLISADGHFIAFTAASSVAGPKSAFVVDLVRGTTARVSVGIPGVPSNGEISAHQMTSDSSADAISADGRYIVFTSDAPNVLSGWNACDKAESTPDGGSFCSDVFVRDRVAGTTEQIDVSSSGAPANRSSAGAAISADGRYVVFTSDSSNLVASGPYPCVEDPLNGNNCRGVFVRDRITGTTQLASVSSSGAPANGDSTDAQISADGRYVAFSSDAANLVAPGASNYCVEHTSGVRFPRPCYQVFVRDLVAGTTQQVSIGVDGKMAVADSGHDYHGLAISADGRFVAFESFVPVDHWTGDVFVRDRVAGTTERLTNGGGGFGVAISADGRLVAFGSFTSPNARYEDVFVRDRITGTTTLVSVARPVALATAAGAGTRSASPFSGTWWVIDPGGGGLEELSFVSHWLEFFESSARACGGVPRPLSGGWDYGSVDGNTWTSNGQGAPTASALTGTSIGKASFPRSS